MEEAERLRLKVNVGKTKVMRINARNAGKIYIKEEEIEYVLKIIYIFKSYSNTRRRGI